MPPAQENTSTTNIQANTMPVTITTMLGVFVFISAWSSLNGERLATAPGEMA
jgi:hypothetical protein